MVLTWRRVSGLSTGAIPAGAGDQWTSFTPVPPGFPALFSSQAHFSDHEWSSINPLPDIGNLKRLGDGKILTSELCLALFLGPEGFFFAVGEETNPHKRPNSNIKAHSYSDLAERGEGLDGVVERLSINHLEGAGR